MNHQNTCGEGRKPNINKYKWPQNDKRENNINIKLGN